MPPAAHALLAELDAETPATRRVLERLPADRFAWQPHPRSLTAGQLAQHVAAIPGNVVRLAGLDGFDVATAPATYAPAESRDALLATLERSVAGMRSLLEGMDDAAANAAWRLTFGEKEIATWSRLTLLRTMGLNHWYHHRGELVVYLRLLDVPVPIVYGRSADENPFARTAA
jgi:uncharacterized damage-inducible protein DinB